MKHASSSLFRVRSLSLFILALCLCLAAPAIFAAAAADGITNAAPASPDPKLIEAQQKAIQDAKQALEAAQARLKAAQAAMLAAELEREKERAKAQPIPKAQQAQQEAQAALTEAAAKMFIAAEEEAAKAQIHALEKAQQAQQEAQAALTEAAAKRAAEEAARWAAQAAAAKKDVAAPAAPRPPIIQPVRQPLMVWPIEEVEEGPSGSSLATTNTIKNSPRATGDVLQFLDGDVLHGTLKGVDAARGLRWEHPDAKSPFDLSPAHLDFVRFNQAKSLALSPSCQVRFAGGDDLFGSVVSLDADTLQFDTWFGGTLKIPRAALQTITFLPTNFSLVYEGPADASDWVIGGGAQNRSFSVNGGIILGNVAVAGAQQVMIVNGQVVVVNSGGASRNGPPGPTNWTWQDGSFVTAGPGTLGRNFGLSGSSTIEFDLSCNGAFNLWLCLYSPALNIVNTASSLVVALSTGQINLLRTSQTRDPFANTAATLTNFNANGKPSHITLQCNEEEHTLAALVDGVEVKRWTGLASFTYLGSGFVVQNQSVGNLVKLSNIRVSKWAGKYEPILAPARATNADMAFFINRDQAAGKVGAITGGRLDLTVGGSLIHIPLERLRQIQFAKSDAVPEPRGPWEVRARFPGGGNVSFQLEKWDDKTISGHSALYGPVAFQAGSICELQFNLDSPRTVPVASSDPAPFGADSTRILDLDYDALDQ